MSLRDIPSVDTLVRSLPPSTLLHAAKVRAAQQVIAKYRAQIEQGSLPLSPQTLIQEVLRAIHRIAPMRRVINATGVVLHTNLGRSPLGVDCLSELTNALSHYCDLEFEHSGRGNRTRRIEDMLCLLLGCEAALAVNNNAAALVLILHSLASGRDAIISRGELIQIGGGFRIPEIIQGSGARMVEIGTTNITTILDYERALTEHTAAILKINPSNFTLAGHSEAATLSQLGALATRHRLPLVFDEGSGAIQDILNALNCVSIACFSADKLFGGPQAGIIVGTAAWIEPLKRSPLYRALRLGKLDIFCLEYLLWNKLNNRPSLTDQLLHLDAVQIRDRATRVAESITLQSEIVEGTSTVGGGASPGLEIPTWLICVQCDERLVSKRLVEREVPVVVRKGKGKILVDLRTVAPSEDREIGPAIMAACSS